MPRVVVINLPLSMRKEYGDQIVKAELLPDLAPHLAHVASFAIHRSTRRSWAGTWWAVSSIELGLLVAGDMHASRWDAIEAARARLRDMDVPTFLRAARKGFATCSRVETLRSALEGYRNTFQGVRAYRVLRQAVDAMMAPLGYHGTIGARDDRVQAVMDALAQIDKEERE